MKKLLYSTAILGSIAFASANIASADEVGTVDSIEFTNTESTDVASYGNRSVSVEFHVDEAEEVQAGDTTTITLPEELQFSATEDFSIPLATETEVHFADANFTVADQAINVIYNENVAGLENIRGGFNFMVSANTEKIPTTGDVSTTFTVGKDTQVNFDFKFTGVGEKETRSWFKAAYQDTANPSQIHNEIIIGQDGVTYSDIIIKDDIAEESEDNTTYLYDTFKATAGTWEWSDTKGWYLEGEEDVTHYFTFLTRTEGEFVIEGLSDLNGRGLKIEYKTEYTSPVELDEQIINRAYLTSSEGDQGEKVAYTQIVNVSGWINADKKKQPTIEVPEDPQPEEPVTPVEPTPEVPETPEEPKEEPKQDEPKTPETPKKDEPKQPVKEEPKEPKKEVEKPKDEVKEAPKSKQVPHSERKAGDNVAVLPRTGAESNALLAFAGFAVLFGSAIAALVTFKKED